MRMIVFRFSAPNLPEVGHTASYGGTADFFVIYNRHVLLSLFRIYRDFRAYSAAFSQKIPILGCMAAGRLRLRFHAVPRFLPKWQFEQSMSPAFFSKLIRGQTIIMARLRLRQFDNSLFSVTRLSNSATWPWVLVVEPAYTRRIGVIVLKLWYIGSLHLAVESSHQLVHVPLLSSRNYVPYTIRSTDMKL
jgi:hypothetical protein